MEAWRQWLLGERKNNVSRSQSKIDLTPTGLLIEGDLTQNLKIPRSAILSVIAIYRQLYCPQYDRHETIRFSSAYTLS